MSTKPWQISRRTMLRGMGAMMSLPLLEAMAPLTAHATMSDAALRKASSSAAT